METNSSIKVNFIIDKLDREHLESNKFHNQVVLFKTKNYNIVNFGLFAAIAAVISIFLVFSRQFQIGLNPNNYILHFSIGIPLLVVLGSRLLCILVNYKMLFTSPGKVLKQTGFAFQGGFIFVVSGLIGLTIWLNIPILMFLDTFVLALPLGHAIGRLGCFTYGCCHGKHTNSKFGVYYTNPDSKVIWNSKMGHIKLHPTQLYSAIANFAIFIFLNVIASSYALKAGQLSALYLIIDSSGRFLIEFLRHNSFHTIFGLTSFQLISSIILLIGIGLFIFSNNSQVADFTNNYQFINGLKTSISFYIYYLVFFLFFFISFGIHGKKVGEF